MAKARTRSSDLASMTEDTSPQQQEGESVESPQEKRGFGFKASAALPTDQHFAARIGLVGLDAPPETCSNQQLVVSILDQGRAESCIANAGIQQLRCEMVRRGLSAPLLSRQFAYYGLRLIEGDQNQDVGGYVRNFYRAANRFGYCSETVLPYNPQLPAINAQPTEKAYMEAAANHIEVGYYRIDFGTGPEMQYGRQLAIKHAIAAGHTVLFGTAVDINKFQAVKSLTLQEAPSYSATVGGHAMLIVGYDAEGVLVANSWGTSWGQDGFGRLSWNYILDPRSSDFWVLEVIKAPLFYQET